MNPGDVEVVDLVLPSGHVTTVDLTDWPLIAPYRWQPQYIRGEVLYAKYTARKDGRTLNVLMHRHLLQPSVGAQVDHINHDGLDNRRINLRVCTPSQNQGNKRRGVNNRSGYKGVRYRSRCVNRPYEASIECSINSKRTYTYLGNYFTAEDAARAYDKAAREQWGEFAYTNFPIESEAS